LETTREESGDMTTKKKGKARWLRRLGLLALVLIVGYFVMSFIDQAPWPMA
jgi:hypothetical protein